MRMRNPIFWGALGLAALGGLLSPRAARGQIPVTDAALNTQKSADLIMQAKDVANNVALLGKASAQLEQMRGVFEHLKTVQGYYARGASLVRAGETVRESAELAQEISREYRAIAGRIDRGAVGGDALPRATRDGYSIRLAQILAATQSALTSLTEAVQSSGQLAPEMLMQLVNGAHERLQALRNDLRGVDQDYGRAWGKYYHDRHQFDFFNELK